MIVLVWILVWCGTNSSELFDLTALTQTNELGRMLPAAIIGEFSIKTEVSIQSLMISIELYILIISVSLGLYDISKTFAKHNINSILNYCKTSIIHTLVSQLTYIIIYGLVLTIYKGSFEIINLIDPNVILDLNFKIYHTIIIPYLIFGCGVYILYTDEVFKDFERPFKIYYSIKSPIWGVVSVGVLTYYLHLKTTMSSIEIAQSLISGVLMIYLLYCLIHKLVNIFIYKS